MTLQLLGQRLQEGGLATERAYGTVFRVACNAAALNQVIANLLNNARQPQNDAPGLIRLGSGRDAHRTWFEVEDTGSGIDHADPPAPSVESATISNFPATDLPPVAGLE